MWCVEVSVVGGGDCVVWGVRVVCGGECGMRDR